MSALCSILERARRLRRLLIFKELHSLDIALGTKSLVVSPLEEIYLGGRTVTDTVIDGICKQFPSTMKTLTFDGCVHVSCRGKFPPRRTKILYWQGKVVYIYLYLLKFNWCNLWAHLNVQIRNRFLITILKSLSQQLIIILLLEIELQRIKTINNNFALQTNIEEKTVK